MMITPSIMSQVSKAKIASNSANAKSIASAVQTLQAQVDGTPDNTDLICTDGVWSGNTLHTQMTTMMKVKGCARVEFLATGEISGVAYTPGSVVTEDGKTIGKSTETIGYLSEK